MLRKVFERIFFMAIYFLLCFNHARAQDDDRNEANDLGNENVLLSKTVDTTGAISKFGANRLFFVSSVFELGEMPGPQVYGSQTNWWSSSLSFGFRMKLKLFYWNSFIVDGTYRYDRFSLQQHTPKLAPLGTMSHERERISLHNASLLFCDRINFKKRGNVLGNWIDLGVYNDWVLRSSNVFVDRHYDSNSMTGYDYKTKTKIVGLPYIEVLNYGLTVRMGSEDFVVFARWRMNSLLNYSSPNNRDLPKLTIGFEVCASWE